MKIAVIGATGSVGRELVHLLLSDFTPCNMSLFASSQSSHKELTFGKTTLKVQDLNTLNPSEYAYAFFATPSEISLTWIPKISLNCVCIDLSQAYRKDPSVPLVIPEINGHLINSSSKIIASPNCTTTLMLMPLFNMHRTYRLKRIIMSTYQAASGGGEPLMQELINDTFSYLNKTPRKSSLLQHPYAFNLFPHNSFMGNTEENEEEKKVLFETHKILDDNSIGIHSTCVRVPVLRVHSLSVNAEFHHAFDLETAKQFIMTTPGVELIDKTGHPMAHEAERRFEVLCGRVRIDTTQKNTISLWIVGDQLLKGAALNAVQILKLHAAFKEQALIERSENI